MAEMREGMAFAKLGMDRQLYETLGEENLERPCRKPGCARGAVRFGVFCRPHHFASVTGRASPFTD